MNIKKRISVIGLKVQVLLFFMGQSVGLVLCQGISDKNHIFNVTEPFIYDTLIMNGKLDGYKTFTRQRPGINSDTSHFKAFEPMKSIVFTNKGMSRIYNPRLILNNRGNWYSLASLATEAVGETLTDREKFLSIWQFVRDNRIHFTPPNMDAYDSFKMLTVYGYGFCELSAWNIRLILYQLGYPSYALCMPNHVVAGVKNNGKNYILDSDIEVFYLNKDNSGFATQDEILKDKYLISRTKHYGKDSEYNKLTDSWISRIYNSFYILEDSKSLSKAYNYKMNMMLRPGESLIYDYGKATKYCQLWDNAIDVPQNFLTNVIANGSFVYSTNFLNAPLYQLADGYVNAGISSSSSPHLFAKGDSCILKIRFDSPLPMLDGELKAKLFKESDNDTIEIFISSDDQLYTKILAPSSTGLFTDSINLTQYFNYEVYDQEMPVSYRYYIKFRFIPSEPAHLVGLDSLYVKNIFQVSRFFLPELKIGENSVQISDSSTNGDQNLGIVVNWKESSENTPPYPVSAPSFPLDNSTIDSLYFEFRWPEAIDPDGDNIVDYEFMLSENKDTKFPLSPNFDLYTSCLGKNPLNRFKVKETGWLNHDSTYYWKVRALDSKGAWSDWSPVWSFKVRGLMPPGGGGANIKDETIFLSWEKNQGGLSPDFYKVYSSNVNVGFAPDTNNFVLSTNDTSAIIAFNGKEPPKSFYRVTACSKSNQESFPSDIIPIPNTIFFDNFDTISPDRTNSLNIFPNIKFTPIYDDREDTLFYPQTVDILQMPNWMTFGNNEFSGTSDDSIYRRMLFDKSFSEIKMKISGENTDNATYTISLISALKDQEPSPYIAGNDIFTDPLFSSIIVSGDGDVPYGDSIKYEILEKPDWLNFYISNDSIFLSGIAENVGEYFSITVKATDSKGEYEIKELIFKNLMLPSETVSVYPNPVRDICTFVIYQANDYFVDLSTYSLSGSLMAIPFKNFPCSGKSFLQYSFENYDSGTYLVRISIRNNIDKKVILKMIKIIKE